MDDIEVWLRTDLVRLDFSISCGEWRGRGALEDRRPGGRRGAAPWGGGGGEAGQTPLGSAPARGPGHTAPRTHTDFSQLLRFQVCVCLGSFGLGFLCAF